MSKQRDAYIQDDTVASFGEATKAAKHAVIIGIDKYEDDRIAPLELAAADAKAIYDILTHPYFGGFPAENVTLLLNEDASYRNIKEAILVDLVERACFEDTVVIYYAGHGAPGPATGTNSADAMEKYFVPYDAKIDRLRAHGVAMSDVNDWFRYIQSRRVIFFIDSCYSGASGGRSFNNPLFNTRASLTDEFLEELSGDGRIVVTACEVNQVSLELKELGHGLFTHYLLEGLRGKADIDGDGRVSISELYQWLYEKVKIHSRKLGSLMEPIQKGDVKGNVYLTHYEEPGQLASREQCDEAQRLFESGKVQEAYDLWCNVLLLEPEHEVALKGVQQYIENKQVQEDKMYRCIGLIHEWRDSILCSEQCDTALELLKYDGSDWEGEHRDRLDKLERKTALIELLYDREPTFGKLMPQLEKILGVSDSHSVP